MCWYTMLERPELYSFNEPCDNFANCYTVFGKNRDPRANDTLPFACAIYSFCPDPCCPRKHFWYMTDCYKTEYNPCKKGNNTGYTELFVITRQEKNYCNTYFFIICRYCKVYIKT